MALLGGCWVLARCAPGSLVPGLVERAGEEQLPPEPELERELARPREFRADAAAADPAPPGTFWASEPRRLGSGQSTSTLKE